ncbi:MAG TPA: GreA/GreB family elongation factor [Sedimentisphaerales bacterium]|jgi:regulator of nucleoside diphosphate kinase|nr:GreA/GreB family elongation factor [Sedimentisphaerales bacterium]HNU31722.1 GreA/GreB family elongation factor [Sedimentisphaerales bacterium]
MTHKRIQQIITRAIAQTPMESWKCYHVCWWEGKIQCCHVHHTKEHHASFFAANGSVFADGLNECQWRLLTSRVEEFCRSRGISLRGGWRPRLRQTAGAGRERRQITEFDSLRLNTLIADIKAPGAPVSPFLDRLERVLESARTVAPREVEANVVTMNSQVRLKDRKGKDEITCSLVFPLDAVKGEDLGKKNVSVLSPMGLSILGRRVGDTIEGRIHVDQMLYQPEAAGDFHL